MNLDAAPLLDLIRRRATEAGMTRQVFVRNRLGDNVERYFWRWNSGLGVTPVVADRVCCTLGIHPGEVWAEWWDIEWDDDGHGTLISYDDGCNCVPCLRAGVDALRARMWAMSPLTEDELRAVHDGTEEEPIVLTLVPELDESEAA